MRKKSTYVVLLVAIFAFSLVMFLAFGLNNIKTGKYATTLLVGDDTVWTYSNKNWLNVTKQTSIKKLDWKKFNIYLNNKKFGEYYLWHDDKWYAFDEKKNAVALDGEMLAYNANHEIKIKEFNESDITDRTYINYVLDQNGISPSSQTTTEYVVNFDYDSDGIEEEFYVISNVFALDFEPETNFAIVFMVKDDTIYYLYNDISSNDTYNGCMPYITSFLDVDNDDKYEMILSCARYSVNGTVKMLYKYDNGEFKIAISNQ
jgi:hypothetical protein